MQKPQKSSKAVLFSLLAAAPFVFKTAIAAEATNCTYTGNSSDYCYASDGTNNLKVINCRPGTTSCYYKSPSEELEKVD